jgi:PKD domain
MCLDRRGTFGTTLVALSIVAWALSSAWSAAAQDKPGAGRPKLNLRANPAIAMSPARVVFSAELVGGADDFEEYYCASVEWEWGDETTSESKTDCDPYEAGKSSITRRFTVQHVYQRSGNYRVTLRLKQRDKQVTNAVTNVQVRPGPREFQ